MSMDWGHMAEAEQRVFTNDLDALEHLIVEGLPPLEMQAAAWALVQRVRGLQHDLRGLRDQASASVGEFRTWKSRAEASARDLDEMRLLAHRLEENLIDCNERSRELAERLIVAERERDDWCERQLRTAGAFAEAEAAFRHTKAELVDAKAQLSGDAA